MKRHVDEELEDEELDEEELEDDDEDVEEIEITGQGSSGLLGFAAGLLVGLIVGVGVAIFAAPERGDVMRRRIRRHRRASLRWALRCYRAPSGNARH